MSWLKKSLIAIFVLVCITVAWVVALYTADDVANISETLDISSKTRFIRWVVIATVIIFWSELIQLIARKKLTDEQINRAKAMHWRIALALIVFEVIVIESAFQYIV